MAPKKRKASTTSAQSKSPAKKVKFDPNVIDDNGTSATGRPLRSTSNNEPQYNFNQKRRSTTSNTVTATTTIAKKRGRPAKAAAVEVAVPPKAKAAQKGVRGQNIESEIEVKDREATGPARKVGRPRKHVPEVGYPLAEGGTATASDIQLMYETAQGEKNASTSDDDGEGRFDENIQYWLMKAEPESRIVKGHEVKFSIDDLAEADEPEAWDGVRNPVARNNMRAMRTGDLAFFYHSNCKVPGIVGLMRIVEEHSIDESAFEPNHPYYDPKSTREKPKWEKVKVDFVKKFERLLSLTELRSFAQQGGILENMQVLKQSRLSVSSVNPNEWKFILSRFNESPALGHGDNKDGYESDTDGEAEDQEENASPVEQATVNSHGYGTEADKQPKSDLDNDEEEEDTTADTEDSNHLPAVDIPNGIAEFVRESSTVED